MKGKNSQEVAALPKNLPERQNSIAREPSVKQKKPAAKRRPLTTKAGGKKPIKKGTGNNMSQSSLLISDLQLRKEQLKSTDSHQIIQQVIYPKLSEARNVSTKTMNAVHQRMESTKVLGSGALIGFEGITTLQKLKQSSEHRLRSAQYHTCTNAGASHVSRNFLIQQPNLTSSAGGFKSSRMVKIQQAREEKPGSGQLRARAIGAPQIKVPRGPVDPLQTKYRLPSLSKCLENQILPKNSQKLKRIYSIASKQGGSESQFNRLLQNELKRRKNFTPTQAILSTQVSGSDLPPPPDVQSSGTDPESLPSPKAVKIQNIELPCACPTPIVPNRHILLSRFVGQKVPALSPKNPQKRGSNEDLLVGTEAPSVLDGRSSFTSRNMMIIGQKRDLQVRKNSSSTSPKCTNMYNTELTAVLLDQSQLLNPTNAISSQLLPAQFEFSKNNSSMPHDQPAPRRKIDLKVQQPENQSGENVSSVVGDQSQNNSQAMVIYYEYFDPDTGQRYLIQNLSQSTAMPPMKMHQQYNTAVVQPPVELLSPLVAAEQNTLPHETTEKRMKSQESFDDFPDLKQITRIDYQIKQVKDPKLPIPISQFDFKGPHAQKSIKIKMPAPSLFDRVKKRRGSNKSKKTPLSSQEKMPRLTLEQQISCGADTLVGASGAFHAIKNNAVLEHIVNRKISGDEVPGFRDLHNQSPSAKDMATQLILSQSMADQSGLTKQGDRSETPSIVKSREPKAPSRFILTHSKKTLDNALNTRKITYSPGPREHTPVPESRQEVLLDKDDLHTQQSNLTEDDSQKVVNSIYNQFDETKFSGENVESVRGHTPLQHQLIGSKSIEDNDSSLTLEKADKGEMEPIKPYCFAFDVNDRQSISHRDHLSKSKNSKKSRTGSPNKAPESEKHEIAHMPEDSNGSEDSSQGIRQINSADHSHKNDLHSKLMNQDGTQSPEYHKHTMFAVSRATDGKPSRSTVHFQTHGIMKPQSIRSSSNLVGRYNSSTTNYNRLKGKKVKLGQSDQRNETAQVKRRRVQSAHPDRGPCKHKILQNYDKKEAPKKQSRHIFIYQQDQGQPNDRYRQSGGSGQKNDGVLSFGNSDYLQEGQHKGNPAQFSFNRKPLITSKESVQQSESSNYSPPPPLAPIQKGSTASLLQGHPSEAAVKEYLTPPDGKIKELQTLSADDNIENRAHSDQGSLPGNRPKSGRVPRLNQIHEIVQKVEIAEMKRPQLFADGTEASFRNRQTHIVAQIREEQVNVEERAQLPKKLLQSTQGRVIEEEGEDSPSVAGKGEVTSADREVEFVFSRQNQLSPHMNEIEQLLQWQTSQPVLFEQGVQMGMMAAVQKLITAHDRDTHIQKISILKRLQEELMKKESDRTSFFADLVRQYTQSKLLKGEEDSIQIQGAKLIQREKVDPGVKMYSMLKKYRRRRRRLPSSNDLLCVQNRRHPPQGSNARLFSPAADQHLGVGQQSVAALIHHSKQQKSYQQPSQFVFNQAAVKQESNKESACLPASLPAKQSQVQLSAFQNRVNTLANNAEVNRRRMVTNTEEGLVNIQGLGVQDEKITEEVRAQRNMFAAKVLLDKGRTLKMDTNQVSKKLLHIIGDKIEPEEIEQELIAMNVSKRDIAQFEKEMLQQQPQYSPAKVNFDLIQKHYPAPPIQHILNPMLQQKSFCSSNMDALQSAHLMRSQNATQLMSTFIKDGNSQYSKQVTPNLLGRSDLSMRDAINASESTFLPMSGIKQMTKLRQTQQISMKVSPIVKMGGDFRDVKSPPAEPPVCPQTTKNQRVTNTFDFEQQKRQTQRWLIAEPLKKKSSDLSYQVAADQTELFRQIMSQQQIMRDAHSKAQLNPHQHFIKVQRTHTDQDERSELVRQTQELLQNPQFQSETSARFAPSQNPPQSTVEVGLESPENNDLVQVDTLNPNI